jgi:hypothetical protein
MKNAAAQQKGWGAKGRGAYKKNKRPSDVLIFI